jgi:hypothetical protein
VDSRADVLVLRLLLLLVVQTAALDGVEVTTALEALRSDKALDLRPVSKGYDSAHTTSTEPHSRLGVRLGVLFLRALNLAAHDVLADVVLLGEVEEATDLRRTLRPEALRDHVVR